ncbi:MAG: tetratricopeptide repeat protein [Pseudomonadota bacterium]
MSKSYIAASAAAIALAISAVPTSLFAADTVSKASAKPLKAAMEAQQSKRCPEAISKSKEALGIGEKTAYDKYVAYGILAYCHQVQGDKAELMSALQGKLDSGIPQAAEQSQIIKNMYGTAFEMKDYAQAIELGNRMIRSGMATPDTYEQIATAMVLQGKQADAVKLLSDTVVDAEKRGQKPNEGHLLRLRDLQDKAGNRDGASATMEKLVVYYPKPAYWELLTHSLAHDPKLNDRQRMHIYRLKFATGNLKQCRDFTEMAANAVDTNMAGEGQKVIEQGLAAKVCTEKTDQARLERMQIFAAKQVGEERARMPRLEADARAAKTGEPDVALGSSQFGFGEYAKSAEWLSRGVGKGGLKDIADAQLTLGVAYLRAGNKAEAIKTFKSIKATDPITQRIVRLWILHAQ